MVVGDSVSANDKAAAIATARDYLTGYLADAQDSTGRWNQPTFDVRV